MEKKKVPEIRLEGFEGEWEKKNFAEISHRVAEKNVDNIPYESYSISNVNGFVSQDEQFENGGNMHDADKRLYYIVPPCAFAYNPARINVGSIGYQNVEKNVIVSSLYEVFLISDMIDDRFIWHWFHSDEFHHLIELYQEGGVRLYFFYDKLCMCDIFIPTFDEQKAIGEYFDNLDTLITNAEDRHTKLLALKKSLLQKMFPQEGESVPRIRFDGFEGDWEFVKFGNIFNEYIEKNHAELPPLTIIQGKGTIHRDDSDRNMHYDKNSLSGYKMVKKDDFILHLRSFEGGLEKANTDGILSPAYHTFHAEEIDVNFYYLFLRTPVFINVLLAPHIYGIRDGKSIDIDGMKTIMLPMPKLSEQKAIGDYFTNLDTLIEAQEQKITKLQQMKMALLQKMFV